MTTPRTDHEEAIGNGDTKPAWCRGRSICGKLEDERMAQPMTDEQRRADRISVRKLHPGNRFRLMFGQPLLPQDDQ